MGKSEHQSVTSKHGIPCNDAAYFLSQGVNIPTEPYEWVQVIEPKNCQ